MRPKLSTSEVGAIQGTARGATQLRLAPRIEARLLELGLLSRRERELNVASAGHLGGNPLFEHWL